MRGEVKSSEAPKTASTEIRYHPQSAAHLTTQTVEAPSTAISNQASIRTAPTVDAMTTSTLTAKIAYGSMTPKAPKIAAIRKSRTTRKHADAIPSQRTEMT